jgi:hypothetical protein
MKKLMPLALVVGLSSLVAGLALAQPWEQSAEYVKKANRTATILATLRANNLPTLEGGWHWIGPFANSGEDAFDLSYPPEKEINLTKSYEGRDGKLVSWKEFKNFAIGAAVNLKLFPRTDNCFVYVYREIDVQKPVELPVSLGSDDSIALWLNGEKLVADNAVRGVAPDQDEALLKLKAGKNQLLIRVGNLAADFAVYICPDLPASLQAKVGATLNKDFPQQRSNRSAGQAEAKYYRMQTVGVPKGIVLEVGGLAFRPDGKLLACTRRGEVWLLENPGAEDPAAVKYKLFATGLHEALGLHVDGKDIYCTQRPELTKLIDHDGDDVADEYATVCDQWGVSGDYHEFAFGPARDKQGNFFISLNVGFGGGHQSKSPWRGWCVKVTPDGKMHPYATGLRSPNGIGFSPDGDLFYCDNQGEWVCTNKMHHLKEGKFYGHPAGLRWVKQSPFAETLTVGIQPKSGMRYDGLAGKNGASGPVQHELPCIWFPYGRMGQSASEPRWDTTAGKFGPFAGQCFVGDQTKSIIMRVFLEKVQGEYQGACFPFRSGFQCGINRLVFAPDGSLYAGQTNRGWGSVGGKDYGLQRLVYTGNLPCEIHSMKLTKDGFDLVFTKALDAKTVATPEAFNLLSFTHYYWSTYGSPEIDRRVETVSKVTVQPDGKTVSLVVPERRPGRIYELRLEGAKSADGDAVLHPEAYYTLNRLP